MAVVPLRVAPDRRLSCPGISNHGSNAGERKAQATEQPVTGLVVRDIRRLDMACAPADTAVSANREFRGGPVSQENGEANPMGRGSKTVEKKDVEHAVVANPHFIPTLATIVSGPEGSRS